MKAPFSLPLKVVYFYIHFHDGQEQDSTQNATRQSSRAGYRHTLPSSHIFITSLDKTALTFK